MKRHPDSPPHFGFHTCRLHPVHKVSILCGPTRFRNRIPIFPARLLGQIAPARATVRQATRQNPRREFLGRSGFRPAHGARQRAARRTAKAAPLPARSGQRLKKGSDFEAVEPRPKTTRFRPERKADLVLADGHQASPRPPGRRDFPAAWPSDDSGCEPLAAS